MQTSPKLKKISMNTLCKKQRLSNYGSDKILIWHISYSNILNKLANKQWMNIPILEILKTLHNIAAKR